MTDDERAPGSGAESATLSIDASGPDPLQEAAAALDLHIARRMFYGGFAALPALWFISWVHFAPAARQAHADPRLTWYVRASLVGTVCSTLAFIAWVVVVQLSWQSDDFFKSIMLNIPESSDDEL